MNTQHNQKNRKSMLERIINWRPQRVEDEIIKMIPIRESDGDKLFEVASDPLIWEQHPTSDRYKREVFELYFEGALSERTAFLIMDKATDKIIGSTRYYDYNPENSSIAIGYTFLAKQYWSGQYNKSSKKLLIDYAFQFVDKIYFHVGATNIRSQLATIKIGATKVGEVDFDHYGKKVLHFEYLIQKNTGNTPQNMEPSS